MGSAAKSNIKAVFGILLTIVIIFLVWQLVLNDGGILKTGYNAIANGINKQWEKAAGAGETVLPLWSDSNAANNGQGFDIDTAP